MFRVRRRFSVRDAAQFAAGVLGLGIVAFVVANIVAFAGVRGELPPETSLGEVEVSGLNPDQAISRTLAALRQPVILRYQNEIIALQPADVDFTVNETVARLQLDQVVRRRAGWDNLPMFALRQYTATRVALAYTYDEQKLLDALSRIAGQFDQAPAPPAADATGLGISPGANGRLLNIADARDPILAALGSIRSRTVELPVDIAPYGSAGLQPLGQSVQAQLKDFTDAGNVAGVFIKDLRSGQEIAVNGDVAFSAKGWLRLALALGLMADGRAELAAPDLLRTALVGDEAGANAALRALGSGDALAGVQALNAVLKRLGLTSTFLAQPYGAAVPPPVILTPGNTRTDISASPDPNAQSTPAEAGSMLEMLDQCARNGGPLKLAFPDGFNAARCGAVMQALGQIKFNGLIEAGSPGATVSRRQTWDAQNHGDAAVVRSPGGEYIVAVVLHGAGAAPLDWSQSAPLIANIARAASGFFNGTVPPPAPALAAPPPQ